MSTRAHWDRLYATRPPDLVGWYTPHLHHSLRLIEELGLPPEAALIDVGGGASTLVDDLLAAGYRNVTVLDLSAEALARARERLGERAGAVRWIVGDVTAVPLPEHAFDVWHDRAVFHFLQTPEARQRYREALLHALRPGGHVVMGTFAPEAPPRCSGLPVCRYTADALADTLGEAFTLQRHHKARHVTPGGVEQMYLYTRFQRTA